MIQSDQFILSILIFRTVLTLQGRIDLARILLALVVGGLCLRFFIFSIFALCSWCGLAFSHRRVVLRLHICGWLPPPSLAFGSGRCRHGVVAYTPPPVHSPPCVLFFLSLIQKERRSMSRVPCSFPPSVGSIWVRILGFFPCSFIKSLWKFLRQIASTMLLRLIRHMQRPVPLLP